MHVLHGDAHPLIKPRPILWKEWLKLWKWKRKHLKLWRKLWKLRRKWLKLLIKSLRKWRKLQRHLLKLWKKLKRKGLKLLHHGQWTCDLKKHIPLSHKGERVALGCKFDGNMATTKANLKEHTPLLHTSKKSFFAWFLAT